MALPWIQDDSGLTRNEVPHYPRGGMDTTDLDSQPSSLLAPLPQQGSLTGVALLSQGLRAQGSGLLRKGALPGHARRRLATAKRSGAGRLLRPVCRSRPHNTADVLSRAVLVLWKGPRPSPVEDTGGGPCVWPVVTAACRCASTSDCSGNRRSLTSSGFIEGAIVGPGFAEGT